MILLSTFPPLVMGDKKDKKPVWKQSYVNFELSSFLPIDFVKIPPFSLSNADLISFYRWNVTISIVAGLSVKFRALGLQFDQFWHDRGIRWVKFLFNETMQ